MNIYINEGRAQGVGHGGVCSMICSPRADSVLVSHNNCYVNDNKSENPLFIGFMRVDRVLLCGIW